MQVDRCICHDITFEALIAMARRENLDFEQLRARTHCADSCGLCEPYIRLSLETGAIAHKVMNPLTAARLLEEARKRR